MAACEYEIAKILVVSVTAHASSIPNMYTKDQYDQTHTEHLKEVQVSVFEPNTLYSFMRGFRGGRGSGTGLENSNITNLHSKITQKCLGPPPSAN